MSWRDPEEARREDLRRALIIGGVLCIGVILWLSMSFMGDEGISSRGFDDRGGGGVPLAPMGRERRTQTGLSFVSRQVDTGTPAAVSGSATSQSNKTNISESSSEQRPHGTVPTAPPPPAGGEEPTPAALAVLGAVGLPSDKKGLAGIGEKSGALADLAAKVIGKYPGVMGAVLNNKWIVDAFYNKPENKQGCKDGNKLKGYLMDNAKSNSSIISAAINNPAVMNAGMNTLFWKRGMECPGFQEVLTNPNSVTELLTKRPEYMAAFTNPNFAGALAKAQSTISTTVGGAK